MKMHMTAEVAAEEIANAACGDAKFMAEILAELDEFFGEEDLWRDWLADFTDRLGDNGRRTLARLAAVIEGGA